MNPVKCHSEQGGALAGLQSLPAGFMGPNKNDTKEMKECMVCPHWRSCRQGPASFLPL